VLEVPKVWMRDTRFVEQVRAVAAVAATRAGELDQDGTFPSGDIQSLAAIGALTAPLPPGHGGFGLGTTPDGALPLLETLRWIGHGSLPLGRLYEGHVNALALIVRFGTAAQIVAAARDAHDDVLFGVWNTEGRDGLTLQRLGSQWQLQGRKTFSSGAGFVGRPLVTARLETGQLMMVLPRVGREDGENRADLSEWRAHGMRASATGSYDFSGLTVTADEIIGNDGEYQREPGFSAGAWRFAAVQLGGIERLLDEGRFHLCRTGRANDPHQLVRTGQAAAAAETAKLWVTRAAQLAEYADDRGDPDRITAYVNLARSAVERAGLDVLELVHRSVGLAGFMRPHPIERVSRDLATYLRQPAPDRALTAAAAYVLDRDTSAAAAVRARSGAGCRR